MKKLRRVVMIKKEKRVRITLTRCDSRYWPSVANDSGGGQAA
ncbi:hypothetical protein [Izhakiella australiensis]|nr:hypothetical protein [Izhakiella australiensis]